MRVIKRNIHEDSEEKVSPKKGSQQKVCPTWSSYSKKLWERDRMRLVSVLGEGFIRIMNLSMIETDQ